MRCAAEACCKKINDNKNAITLEKINGNVKFEGLFFKYPNKNKNILFK